MSLVCPTLKVFKDFFVHYQLDQGKDPNLPTVLDHTISTLIITSVH